MTAQSFYAVRWTLGGDAWTRARVLAQLHALPQAQRPNVIARDPALIVVSPDDNWEVRRIMTDAGATCTRER